MMPWVPGVMDFCYVRGHKDTQRTSMLWHKGRNMLKWAIEVWSREASAEKALLALGRFFSVLQQEKAICPLKVKREFNQNIWELVISSLKWYFNEICKVGLWLKNKVSDISSYEHVRKEESVYFFVWTENLNYPEPSVLWNRSGQEAEKEVNKLSEGKDTALSMPSPQGRSLRVAGKGTGHRNPAKQGSFMEGQRRKKKGIMTNIRL